MEKVLLTGIAGFIGFHTAQKLLSEGFEVVGLDNINDYYEPQLKIDRLAELGIEGEQTYNKKVTSTKEQNLKFIKLNLEDKENLKKLFEEEKFDYIINLAAQAGVRYSFVNPQSYIERNVIGFFNILELLRDHKVKHLVYASSSSVYGMNTNTPFGVNDNVDHPVSLYAATKKTNELMAHSYSHLFDIPSTGLRFFTVYGPWGRPDMMLFLLSESITKGKEVELYDGGNLWRDYTFIDDIVEGIVRVMKLPPQRNEKWDSANPEPSTSSAPYRVLNIGHGEPVQNIDLVRAVEKAFGKKTSTKNVPAPKTEVFKTYADTSELEKLINYKPKVSVEEGVKKFVEWYKEYYKIN